MSDEMNFDDIMRQKMSEGDFPFSESNWERAEAMIIAAEKKKKRRIIFFIFFLGALVGIAFMLPFVFNGSKAKITDKIKETNSTNNISTQQKNEGISNLNKQLGEISDEKGKDVKQNVATDFEFKPVKENQSSYNLKHENSEKITPKNASQSQLSSNNQKQIVYKDNKGKDVVKTKGNGNEKQLEASFSSTKEVNKQQNNSPEVKAESSISTTAPISAKEKEKTDSVVVLTATKKDTLHSKLDTIIQGRIDSTQVAPVVENKQKEEPKQKKDFISIDVGTNYCFGWKNNTHTEGAGFNVLAGLSYTHYFNQQWSALIGVQYNNLSHLTESYSSVNTQYNFGYVKNTVSVTPKTLHYLAIPLKAQFNLNSKNILAVGVTSMILLNSKSAVDTYSQGDYLTSSHTIKNMGGYMDGLNSFDMQFTLAYRRRFLKRFVIGAEAYYGILDLRNNSFWGNHISENNRGLKLVLSYNFIK